MLEEEMRKADECGVEKFSILDDSEKTIATLGDRWWSQTAKREGKKVSNKCKQQVLCNIWKKRDERPNV